ncbi:tetratricopeptide repeat protein [Streptomyces abikoensis]|uniref:tetratricopeptide repeat protein n=1 Tax=Streptomyces abikoensis TaxID=97398 RepID=UPI00167A8AAF|nr:tetratricopeptide repeat protein [Streptomyces abikoensis]
MPEQGTSLQELIARQHRSGLVGRQAELACFQENLRQPADDPSHRFVFHLHGVSGVGKTFLLQQMISGARAQQALTAYVTDAARTVVDTMAAIGAELARQGCPLRKFDGLLATYHRKLREADALAHAERPAPGREREGSPSASSRVAARIGLASLGLVPGLGFVAEAADATEVAQAADRLREWLGGHFHNREDVDLVMSPVRTLTPAFTKDLRDVAARRSWVALFLDDYERTAPVLDDWLRELLLSDVHGALPGNAVLALAGQQPLGHAGWGDQLGVVQHMPLDVFTEAEARQLLAAKGIGDEHSVRLILRESGRLPRQLVLMARNGPDDPHIADVSDATVERALKDETDPVRHAAAAACALPRRFDEEVYRAAVEPEAAGHFDWLRTRPFVTDQGGTYQYTEPIRAAFLRRQRHHSPRRWYDRHRALAGTFEEWRLRLEEALAPEDRWADDRWVEYALEERYHHLCAFPRISPRTVTRFLVDACAAEPPRIRRCADMLAQAGETADLEWARGLGQRLLAALPDEHADVTPALDVLLGEPGLDTDERVTALVARAERHRRAGRAEDALADYRDALQLDPSCPRVFTGRGILYRAMSRLAASRADFTRALELTPGDPAALAGRGATHRLMGRYGDALTDLQRAIEINPELHWAHAERGWSYLATRQPEAAFTAFTRALGHRPDDSRLFIGRACAHRFTGHYELALADCGHALRLKPDSWWAHAVRGATYRLMERNDEALADLTRAIELRPDYDWCLAGRGEVHRREGRFEEALRDLDHALRIQPDNDWALARRGAVYCAQRRTEEALADFQRSLDVMPDYDWALIRPAGTYRLMGHEFDWYSAPG